MFLNFKAELQFRLCLSLVVIGSSLVNGFGGGEEERWFSLLSVVGRGCSPGSRTWVVFQFETHLNCFFLENVCFPLFLCFHCCAYMDFVRHVSLGVCTPRSIIYVLSVW